MTTAEISSKLSICSNLHHRVYRQILLSVSLNSNKKAVEYAAFLGVTKSKIYKVVALYNKNGSDFTATLNWRGRRDTTSHMSFEEEQIVMNDLAVMAVNVTILVANHILELIEKSLIKLFQKITYGIYSKDIIGRRKCQGQSTKKNKEVQEEFKKNSTKYWQPRS